MNFGMAFATGKIPGVKLDLSALNDHHEPASAEEALQVYSNLLLPQRDQAENVRRLTALLNENGIDEKIQQAASKQTTEITEEVDGMMNEQKQPPRKNAGAARNMDAMPGNNGMLQQVTGIIIGSPEFQRR
jgi:predicted DsbA family dithiol-disulfide isomerase